MNVVGVQPLTQLSGTKLLYIWGVVRDFPPAEMIALINEIASVFCDLFC